MAPFYTVKSACYKLNATKTQGQTGANFRFNADLNPVTLDNSSNARSAKLYGLSYIIYIYIQKNQDIYLS